MKKQLLIAVLVLWVGYSYSSYYFGSSNNAVNNAYSWSMDNILPDYYNLAVNGVYYTYTPIKNREDAMKVYVQNENPNGGYIFKETDDWSGKSGGIPIRKVIGLEYIPRELWGDGSIEIEGTGSIKDAQVVYSYRYEDGCATPLDNPTCPGYSDAVLDLVPDTTITEIYDALEDENINREETEVDNKKEEQEQEDVKEDDRLERALAINEETLELGNSIAQNQMLDSMNNAIQMNNYYIKTIDGGVYKETVTLKDSNLPDNKYSAILNLSEDIKHNKMVNLQYEGNKL